MNDSQDMSRRSVTGALFAAFGAATLVGCATESNGTTVVTQSLNGTDLKWVDTSLGNVPAPPTARNGDLASNTASALGATVVIAKGCLQAGDGGGGLFYWDNNSGTDDGGTVIVPGGNVGSTGACWRRVYTGPLSAKWFGAKGDGTTNDSLALNNAIAAAVSVVSTLLLPPGVYFTGTTSLTTPTTSGGSVKIIGAGKRVSRISRTSSSATHTFDVAFTGSGVVEIADLTIEGPTGLDLHNESFGIKWWAGDVGHRLRLERVEITGKHDTALTNSGGGRVEIIDCDLEATDACVGMFSSSTNPDGDAFFLARGGVWKTPNGDLSASGSVGLYIHPHIAYNLQGVSFEKLGRYGIYQNGSPTAARGPAVAAGCRFIDCEMCQTKGNGVSDFVGCVVKGMSLNLGSSSLDGRVNVSGCTFERGGSINYGAGTFSKVSITGCLFIDTPIGTAGSSTNHWSVRSSTIIVTDAGTSWLGVSCVSGITEIDNVTFVDETTTNSYQTFVRMTVSSPTVKVKTCRFRNGRGTLASGIYMTTGTLTVEDCEFTAGNTPEAIYVATGLGANVLDGENNRFLNGAYVYVQTTSQQRLVRRRGVNPTTVASASSIDSSSSAFANFDTHVVTGSATISNLTQPTGFVGVVRLVVATSASWSTSDSDSGNIAPKSTEARAAGSVVELLWEPTAAKWLEV